jgi:hypothetical protein
MHVQHPAIPALPPRGALDARRDWRAGRLATAVTVLTATIAVVMVAAATVAIAID